ncbi:MAG: ATP-binding cassette domain-containing protein, partial [bacterium]|nr:ATP-binding cassette domain-containing protein [bacterium]
MQNSVLEVSHLTKTFGSFVAVDDISFSIADGEILGLLGPNGAGKTT